MAFQAVINITLSRFILKPSLSVFVTIPLRIMENNSVSGQIDILLGRLKEAERRAKLLNNEVKSIRVAIAALQETVSNPNITNPNILLIEPTVFAGRHTLGTSIENLPGTSRVDGPLSSKRAADASNSSSKKLKVSVPMENGYVCVYTDGACENNGKAIAKAGIGVWFEDNHPLNISKPVQGKATNNHAEIRACIEALNTIKENGGEKVKIFTDSEFTINCITKWMARWKINNWRTAKGEPVKNKEELQELDRLINAFTDVQWVHIYGHKGTKGNEAADRLAREGAQRYKPN